VPRGELGAALGSFDSAVVVEHEGTRALPLSDPDDHDFTREVTMRTLELHRERVGLGRGEFISDVHGESDLARRTLQTDQ
jgi:hypothetical protein